MKMLLAYHKNSYSNQLHTKNTSQEKIVLFSSVRFIFLWFYPFLLIATLNVENPIRNGTKQKKNSTKK
jgi:hypothetical protein